MLSLSMFVMMAAEADPAGGPSIWNLMLPYLAFIGILYFFMSAPQRREQSRRDQALKNLKKNDRVVTIGGIFGSVANISQDGKEVTLKVDDNTRIRFRKTAIADVLSEEAPAEAAPKAT